MEPLQFPLRVRVYLSIFCICTTSVILIDSSVCVIALVKEGIIRVQLKAVVPLKWQYICCCVRACEKYARGRREASYKYICRANVNMQPLEKVFATTVHIYELGRIACLCIIQK
jgi:hypothetical protein